MPVPEVDVATFVAEREQGAPLIDVREPDEFEEVRVPGAVLIPLADVPELIDEFPVDRTVYLICRSGARSGKACQFLRTQGIDAVNIAGGMLAWMAAGQPVDRGPID